MEGGEVVGAVMAGGVRGWRFSGCHLVVVSRYNTIAVFSSFSASERREGKGVRWLLEQWCATVRKRSETAKGEGKERGGARSRWRRPEK
ncbi:hypothetical protein HAX54_017399, partial [Datura stramonium]|nr:hypothetical protein [Datura stramonium]